MTNIHDIDYGGIFLESHEIRYEEIDPPLRSLIRLINSQHWVRTYGCCAGHAHHGGAHGDRHQFFIGLFASIDPSALNRLKLWVDEANRINGSTGLRAVIESVPKHPMGQGSVDGWSAYRLVLYDIRNGKISLRPQTYLRMIRSLEMSWNTL